MNAPSNDKRHARQAYGFFYMRPEKEHDALMAAKRALRTNRNAFNDYLSPSTVGKMSSTSSLEAFLQHMHYGLTRDGEGRIISLLRRDEPAIIPALDYRVLEAMASYADGAELVFANEFGD